MKFKKYSSIENSYRTKFLDTVKQEGLNGGEFIVQEKAHGANFSMWTDGETIWSAKRSSFLSEDETLQFYNAHVLIDTYKDNVLNAFNYLKNKLPETKEICIYGELIGGFYPHKEVLKDNKASRIQAGVDYCPHNDFYAFDIMVDGLLVSQDLCIEVFEQTKFLYAKPLFRGTLDECLEFSPNFQTTIPSMLGLPLLVDNFAEGVVIKPNEPKHLNGSTRVIFKNKTEKFQEKGKPKKEKIEETFSSPQAEKYLEELSSYVTENRLRAVLSKIGPVSSKDFGKVMQSYVQDIMEDFLKDNEKYNTDKEVEKKDRKMISKIVTQRASNTIRKNFLNIIDGIF